MKHSHLTDSVFSQPVRTTSTTNSWERIFQTLVLLLVVCSSTRQVDAQTSWEVTPYDIEISLALGPAPELHDRLVERLCKTVMSQSSVLVGPAWNVICKKTPQPLSYACLHQLKELRVEDIEAIYPEALKRDKIIFVSIRAVNVGFVLQVREMDARARTWGKWHQRHVLHVSGISESVVDEVLAVFSPLAQIGKPVELDEDSGRVATKNIFTVRFRAGALVTRKDSPVLVETGAVLQPILRRNDRLGRPKPGGVKPVPWTFLILLEGEGSERVCAVHSGMRSPINAKISRRVDRLALAVNPKPGPSRLRLRSSVDAEVTLAGYELYSRLPGQSRSGASEFLGESDFDGMITIFPGPVPLRIVYVKNGGELLARLPIVPGLVEEMNVSIFDDSARLEAEGFVRGLQSNLVDRIVEREILATRIRRRVTAGKFEEARELLMELRTLKLPSHLVIDVARERQRLATSDSRTQAKINKLFAETEKTLRNYADARDIEQLTSELDQAQQAAAAQGGGS